MRQITIKLIKFWGKFVKRYNIPILFCLFEVTQIRHLIAPNTCVAMRVSDHIGYNSSKMILRIRNTYEKNSNGIIIMQLMLIKYNCRIFTLFLRLEKEYLQKRTKEQEEAIELRVREIALIHYILNICLKLISFNSENRSSHQ